MASGKWQVGICRYAGWDLQLMGKCDMWGHYRCVRARSPFCVLHAASSTWRLCRLPILCACAVASLPLASCSYSCGCMVHMCNYWIEHNAECATVAVLHLITLPCFTFLVRMILLFWIVNGKRSQYL
jgi:hypothetical protein